MASTEGNISTEPSLPLTPPAVSTSLPSDSAPDRTSNQSPPINIATLNNAPAPIPIPTSPTAATTSLTSVVIPDPVNPAVAEPAVVPTVAETGMPVSAGKNGPGPASGSLLDIHAASPTAGPRSAGLPGRSSSISEYGRVPTGGAVATPPKFESAEEEKMRLQRQDRERILAAEAPPAAAQAQAQAPAFESAEDEKKRLEREEREKILSSGGSDAAGGPKRDDEDLPPYQDM
jgi:hypothetical protein